VEAIASYPNAFSRGIGTPEHLGRPVVGHIARYEPYCGWPERARSTSPHKPSTYVPASDEVAASFQ
jgi:hypothetical protein